MTAPLQVTPLDTLSCVTPCASTPVTRRSFTAHTAVFDFNAGILAGWHFQNATLVIISVCAVICYFFAVAKPGHTFYPVTLLVFRMIYYVIAVQNTEGKSDIL